MSPALPLALYVHFPWCVRKCPYCDFNSHAVGADLPAASYVDRLIEDLEREIAALPAASQPHARVPLESMFLGGGTPSLFPGDEIARLLAAVARHAALPAEITLEANPGTVDADNFRAYRDAGVNRLSIGVQSFSASSLQALGRVHDGEQARRAVDLAFAAGFANVNVDIMYGLPGQQPEDSVRDLESALALGVQHVSWYQLTIEANTAFHRQPPVLPDEDVVAAIEEAGMTTLRAAGFERYEVSAWARAGAFARHNVNYWQFGDYVGIGAGAHGKVSSVTGDGMDIWRYQKSRLPQHYMADSGRRQVTPIGHSARPIEFMLNALRLVDGVDAPLFTARTGMTLDCVADIVADLRRRGLLRAERLATTDLGLRFLDTVVAAFSDTAVAEVADNVTQG